MEDRALAAPCGIYCGACEFLGGQCAGCVAVAGRPFWTEQVPEKVCPIFDCCVDTEGLEHCGLCDTFPCKTFLELRDPSMSDEEAERALADRQAALLRRSQVGTETWLSERSK